MTEYMLLLAVIVLAGALLSRFSQKLGLTFMLLFTAMGLICGRFWPDSLRQAQTPQFIWNISVWGMVLIVFSSGFTLRIDNVRANLKRRALLLGVGGAFLIILLTAFFCWQMFGMSFGMGVVLASVLTASDVSALLLLFRSGKLPMKENSAAMLALMSGSSIPVCAILLAAGSSLALGQGGLAALWVLCRQLLIGGLCGVLIGIASSFVMSSLEFFRDGMDLLFLLGIALASYAIPTILGGAGFLSVWLTGLYLGGGNLSTKRELTRSTMSLAGFAQVMLFFLPGLAASMAPVLPVIDMTVVLLFAILFVIKPLVYYVLTRFWKPMFRQVVFLTLFSVTGVPTASLAYLAAASVPEAAPYVLPIALVAVILSVAIKDRALPALAARMELESPDSGTRMLFNDFQEHKELQSLCLEMENDHPFIGKQVDELNLPEGLRLALIRRRGWIIPPQYDTHIMEGDSLILGAKAKDDRNPVHLWEVVVQKDHAWMGKMVSELELSSVSLLVAINRGGKMVYPEARMTFEEGDRVVIYSQKNSLW